MQFLRDCCYFNFLSFYPLARRAPRPVWPDWAIYYTLGNFSKLVATISLPKSPTFQEIFCKSFIFLVKSLLDNFYRHLATLYWSCLINSGVVWPDVGIKSCPSFFKSCLKSSLTSLIKKSMVFTTAQNSPPYIWAAFVIKFVSKTFQKSPNLFTLFRCPELGKPS